MLGAIGEVSGMSGPWYMVGVARFQRQDVAHEEKVAEPTMSRV